VSSQKVAYHRFDDRNRISDDSEINALISPYRDQLSDEMNEVIGMSDMNLRKAKPESTMGNWFADILKDEASRLYGSKVDCAFQNYGGLRVSSLSKGEVTRGEIFELMPFENMLVVIEAKGEVLRKLLDRIAVFGGWPSSKGLSFEIKDTIAHNIMLDGKPLDDQANYVFALPDYISNGGDNCDFLKDQKSTNLNVLLRDAVIQNLKRNYNEGQIIHSKLEGRIKLSQSNP
jgi:2',3'-cyclic-nucleotide 2'-phosphodiesterase (5'-nucleotidase family)